MQMHSLLIGNDYRRIKTVFTQSRACVRKCMKIFFGGSVFFMIMASSAMDTLEVHHKPRINKTRNQGRWRIEFDDAPIWYEFCNDFSFLKKYNVSKKDGLALLPVECSDPLPICHCGNTRYFFESAKERYGHTILPGRTYKILDPSIQQLAMVKVISGRDRAIAYLGIDCVNVKYHTNGDRTYRARIMKIETFLASWKEHCGVRPSIPAISGPRVSIPMRYEDCSFFTPQDLSRELQKAAAAHRAERSSSQRTELLQLLLGYHFENFDESTFSLKSLVNYWPRRDKEKIVELSNL